MTIEERTVDGITVLNLHGRLTIGDGAELLRDKVASVVFQGQNNVVLNLNGVPYMDSGGLGQLVRCSVSVSKANGAVKLVELSSKITDLLTITKLLTVFDTYETEAQALASFTTKA
jgi:anti-sigma B factor antagonist